MAGFASFHELTRQAVEGRDFAIRWQDRPARLLVMAVHGGGIEPGTTEIAEAIAGADLGFYTFMGLRPQGNIGLHITSRRFDEPAALALAGRAEVIVTVHGCQGTRPLVLLGGTQRPLLDRLEQSLAAAGFEWEQDPRYPGLSPANICNRGRSGRGVQLELTMGLRRRFFADPALRHRSCPTPVFDAFVQAVRAAIGAGPI